MIVAGMHNALEARQFPTSPTPCMIAVTFSLLTTYLALFVVGMIMLARASERAPQGFEDAGGFHVVCSTQASGAKPLASVVEPAPTRELVHVA